MALIETSREDGVAILTLNRPERRNAVISPMIAELDAAVCALESDQTVRVVIVTGAGADFCVGGDRELTARMAVCEETRRILGEEHERVATRLLNLEVPTIAAVNGRAFGFGAELAAFCDMTVMSAEATLADPHVPLGLEPAPGVLMVWPQLTSRAIAIELLLTGRPVGAEEAVRLGLANMIAPAGAALAAARELARRLCALPPAGVAHTKRALRRTFAPAP